MKEQILKLIKVFCKSEEKIGLQQFEKIIVIGSEKIAFDVLQFVDSKKKQYEYEVAYVEYGQSGLSVMKSVCEKQGIPYCLINDKNRMQEYIERERGRILIISAGNHYIFPESIVNKRNTVIINFHYALLPKYPGRNAPTWAIFHNEEESGATWHYVTERIDDGQVIIQKRCRIAKDAKAYELSRTIMQLAYEGFKECFDDIMFGRIKTDSENVCHEPQKMYYSYEIPNQGMFHISDGAYFIYKLLRATDYGKSQVFPLMRTRLPDGRMVEIVRYTIKGLDDMTDVPIHINEEKQVILLALDEKSILKMKFRILNDGKEK